MYLNDDERKIDEEKLYQQLMAGVPEFCSNLSWLTDKAMNSSVADRYNQMWKVYLSVMTKVGSKLFGGDVYWNTDSDMIEPVLDMLVNEGYHEIILQLILGANNMLYAIKPPDYVEHMSTLRRSADQYYAITRKYIDGGVMQVTDRMVKWDYIDHSNRLFGAAYDIVEYEAKRVPNVTLSSEKSETVTCDSLEMMHKKIDELLDYIKPWWKKFLRRIFRDSG